MEYEWMDEEIMDLNWMDEYLMKRWMDEWQNGGELIDWEMEWAGRCWRCE